MQMKYFLKDITAKYHIHSSYLEEQNVDSTRESRARSQTAHRKPGPPQANFDQWTGSKELPRGQNELAQTGRRGARLQRIAKS